MKNIIYIGICVLMALFSCRNDELDPRPRIEDHIGAVTLIKVDPENNFFNLFNPAFETEAVVFEIDVDGFEVTEIESVDVLIQYIEDNGTVDEEGKPADSVYAPVKLETVTTFPSTVTITAQEVADALDKAVSDFEAGDEFIATFPINTADGRRLTVALASDLCNQPAQPSAGGCSVQWAVACPSDIPAGQWRSNVPNPAGGFYQIEITSNGGGAYSITNLNLDYDPGFYGRFNTLTIGGGFTDVCNVINLGKAAQFGVTWTGTGAYDPDTQTITIPEISDPAFGRGPWTNGGEGYVFTKI